ncbi:hypothetical protein F2Q68_00013866 [Brassica cretica]|uniref:Uncharacterized protein n=1 Tax=Brassica cretica TaxID=69181 RepID=A0A8S9HH30_BRACR|nr:hypothetical protein F2Q68_00013866 [Brassica cretica]
MAGLLIPATHFHSGDVGWYRGCGFEWFTVQIRRGRSFGLVLGDDGFPVPSNIVVGGFFRRGGPTGQFLLEREQESFIPLSHRFLIPVKVSRGSGFGSSIWWFPQHDMAGLLIPATHFHSGDVGWYRGCGFEWFTSLEVSFVVVVPSDSGGFKEKFSSVDEDDGKLHVFPAFFSLLSHSQIEAELCRKSPEAGNPSRRTLPLCAFSLSSLSPRRRRVVVEVVVVPCGVVVIRSRFPLPSCSQIHIQI